MFLNFRNIAVVGAILFWEAKRNLKAKMRRVIMVGDRVVCSALKNVFCFCYSVRNQGTNFA
jgi:hypothetical protein